MRSRNVTLRPLATHPTATDAIAVAENYDRGRHQANEDRVLGKLIEDVRYADDKLAIRVDDAWLLVSIRGGEAAYHISGAEPPFAAIAADDPMLLRFGGQAHRWSRLAISNALVGQALARIFVTPDFLYLYITNADIIAISVQLDADGGAPFLYWDFSE